MEACSKVRPKQTSEASLLPEPPAQLTAPPPLPHDHWRRLLPSSLASSILHIFLLSLAALVTVVEVEPPARPMDTSVVVLPEKDYEIRRIEEPKIAPKEIPKDLGELAQEQPKDEKIVAEEQSFKSRGPVQEHQFGPGIIQPLESLKVRSPDVIYVPTPQAVVEEMLRLAKVQPGNVVMDLGCGDGRIPITAAKKYGAWGYGYDIDPDRVKEAQANVTKQGVGRVVIEQRDVFKLDLSRADVVTLYLLPSLNVKLIPQLQRMKPGTRVVSHNFDMAGVKPDLVKQVANPETGIAHNVYLWTLPLKKEDGQLLDPPLEPVTPGKLTVTEDEVLWNRLGIAVTVQPAGGGFQIDQVRAGGAASRAGIRVGDRLVTLGGYDVRSKRAEAVYQTRLEIESMSFELIRGGPPKILGWLKPDVWER